MRVCGCFLLVGARAAAAAGRSRLRFLLFLFDSRAGLGLRLLVVPRPPLRAEGGAQTPRSGVRSNCLPFVAPLRSVPFPLRLRSVSARARYITDLACDYVVPDGDHCEYDCPGCGAPTYAADGACPCVCADQYDELSDHSYVVDDAETTRPPLARRAARRLLDRRRGGRHRNGPTITTRWS